MGPPSVTVRCPSCGRALTATLAPAPPTQWFPCPSCHAPVPVVVPRDPPPLYTWEVVAGLYPRLVPPRPPRWRPTTIAAVALAAASVLAAVSAGLLGYEGYAASQPTTVSVSGTVFKDAGGGLLVPAPGAHVSLSVDGNLFAATTAGPGGAFQFVKVPGGGLELNVTAAGYGPTIVYTFASRSYSTQTHGLSITLEPGGPANSSVNALTPFADLETLLAYVGGASVLFGVASLVAAGAALAVRRPDGAVPGVVGAGAAIAVPAVLLFLSLGDSFPYVTILAGVVGGAGAVAMVVAALELASRPAPSS